MLDFETAAAGTKSQLFKQIYGILARGNKSGSYTADGIGKRTHSISDIDEVKAVTWDHILAQRAASGEETQSIDEAHKSLIFT